MRIDTIELHNFGSYEGTNTFDLRNSDPTKRIVIVGGKNGAGKTTLFTAVQLGLYGHYSLGYKTLGKRYYKDVYMHINNRARVREDENAYVRIEFQHSLATDVIKYEITREWKLSAGALVEVLSVSRNGIMIETEDIPDFQNYLLHLIPPDMLKLYFFDGERISDYFLSEQKINIKEALMILSGNDTFDILHSDVRRVWNATRNSSNEAENVYVSLQDKRTAIVTEVDGIRAEIQKLSDELVTLESSMDTVKTQYVDRGGITIQERDRLLSELKAEEEKRERLNIQRKNVATDVLPFHIMKSLVAKVQPQIKYEEDLTVYRALAQKLESESFQRAIERAITDLGLSSFPMAVPLFAKSISETMLEDAPDYSTPIFSLSDDEKMQIHAVLNRIADFDPASIKRYQKRLVASLARTKELRNAIQNSSIDNYEEYLRDTAGIERMIETVSERIAVLRGEEEEKVAYLGRLEAAIPNARKLYEAQLKNESVSTISGKVLLLIEELQTQVYDQLLRLVEGDLKYKLRQLLRKNDFFSDVQIDKDFNVHLLRNRQVPTADILAIFQRGGMPALQDELGVAAVAEMFGTDEKITPSLARDIVTHLGPDDIELPVEIDKNGMSSGEKQIFVMSLYWALMQQSNNDLPFFIDTPFARIDTEHRANITEYFFMELTGQLFILSTNEELNGNHIEAMSESISKVFTLEFGDDMRTTVHDDIYFEV